MKAFGLPDGANCHNRVNKMEVNEKQIRNDSVGHGFVTPTET